MRDETKQDVAAIVARHVADERPGQGAHRGPLPDESLTYPCVECGCDWPCDVVLVGRWLATLPSTAEYNAVSEDREMWRRLTGEAQQEAGDLARQQGQDRAIPEELAERVRRYGPRNDVILECYEWVSALSGEVLR